MLDLDANTGISWSCIRTSNWNEGQWSWWLHRSNVKERHCTLKYSFSWILISHFFCQKQNVYPSKHVMKIMWLCGVMSGQNFFPFKAQMWTCFALTRTMTGIVHFGELWLAQIFLSAVAIEWNFIYSSLSYSVLFLAHYPSYFRLSRLSIIQTIQLSPHEIVWSRFDFNTEVRLCKRLALASTGLVCLSVCVRCWPHHKDTISVCVHRGFRVFFYAYHSI